MKTIHYLKTLLIIAPGKFISCYIHSALSLPNAYIQLECGFSTKSIFSERSAKAQPKFLAAARNGLFPYFISVQILN